MTKPKFNKDDRVYYNGGMEKREAKVLLINSARPEYQNAPFYDIQIKGNPEVYTVHESHLRPLMSDTQIARWVMSDYQKAQEAITNARAALKRVRLKLEEDGQPDYELRMLDEFDIVLKNTLRFELTTEVNRWHDIYVERKKG